MMTATPPREVPWPVRLDSSPDRKSAYREYLASPEWKTRGRQVRARDGHRCQDCGRRGQLHVHHLTYANAGEERLWQLITVCTRCHQARHDQHYKRDSEGLMRDFLGGHTAWRREHWVAQGWLRPAAEVGTFGAATRREQSFYSSVILDYPGWELRPPPDAPAGA